LSLSFSISIGLSIYFIYLKITKMKKFSFLIVMSLSIYSSSYATIRRVGFFGTPLANVDYSTFANAYTAAVAGDTILMFPSTVLSGTITKKLTIIGPGSWLNPANTPKGNANEQANPDSATASSVFLNAGSDGTVIMGMNNGDYFISANNITISRNYNPTVYIAYNQGSSTTPVNTSGLQLQGNYLLYFANYYTAGTAVTSLNITNNFMNQFTLNPLNTYSGNISNNQWVYDSESPTSTNGGTTTLSTNSGIDLGNGVFLFQNNIIISYTNVSAASNYNWFAFTDDGNTVFNYNLISQSSNLSNITTNGTGNVVLPVTNISAVFTAFPLIGSSSGDARYQLGASSAALTVGAGSTAIGMFAGSTPYKLSTIPTIPSIYSLSSPQGNNPSGSTIQINVSTRGNN
jgi:hypothetical protein